MEKGNRITYIGKLKEFLSSNTSSAQVTKVILCIIAVSSIPIVVSVAVTAGNAVKVLSLFEDKGLKKKEILLTIASLKQRKLIEYINEKNGVTTIRITKKGKSLVKHFAIDSIRIKIPYTWDKKWHIVMFDIPIRLSKARDALRFKLKQMGFIQFQKSVWIYPYECEDEIMFISKYYKAERYVKCIKKSFLSDDLKLRKKFNLS